MFIPTERWTLILKMVEREIFLMKLKHQYHLSQLGECIYSAQLWKKRGYYMNPCLSLLTDELWFQKMVGSEVFLVK